MHPREESRHKGRGTYIDEMKSQETHRMRYPENMVERANLEKELAWDEGGGPARWDG